MATRSVRDGHRISLRVLSRCRPAVAIARSEARALSARRRALPVSAVARGSAPGRRGGPPTKSSIASPPNFSRAARASSNATAASATTASASTADVSLRSTSASPASPVWPGRRSAAVASASAAASSLPGRRSPRRSRCPPRCRRLGLTSRSRPPSPRTISSWAGRAARSREREAVADLDALHRLDAHQRCGQPRVEPRILRRVRAEPGRRPRARAPRRRRRACRDRRGRGRSPPESVPRRTRPRPRRPRS